MTYEFSRKSLVILLSGLVGVVLVVVILQQAFLGASDRSELVYFQESGMDAQTERLFEHRLAVARAAIEARTSADQPDLRLLEAAASDAYFLGRLKDAEELYALYLHENPLNYVAWGAYAAVLEKMGDIEGAEDAYLQSLNLAIDSGSFFRYIRFLQQYYPEERNTDIRLMYELALKELGDEAWIVTGLGGWYLQNGDCDQAIAHYEKAVQLATNKEAAQQDLDGVRQTCGR